MPLDLHGCSYRHAQSADQRHGGELDPGPAVRVDRSISTRPPIRLSAGLGRETTYEISLPPGKVASTAMRLRM